MFACKHRLRYSRERALQKLPEFGKFCKFARIFHLHMLSSSAPRSLDVGCAVFDAARSFLGGDRLLFVGLLGFHLKGVSQQRENETDAFRFNTSCRNASPCRLPLLAQKKSLPNDFSETKSMGRLQNHEDTPHATSLLESEPFCKMVLHSSNKHRPSYF